jgi:enoyl-CoA hydratase/carnithine racemase
MSERVTIEIVEHVATVTLSRPEKYNALDPAMFDAITEAGEALAGNRSVRAVVLTGAGGNFSAGLDVSSFGSTGGDFATVSKQLRGDSPANRFQSPGWVWRALPVPVIAAIEGVCYGGGLQIACGADIRIAAPDARLSVMEIKWGLIPDMAFTATLQGVLPLDHVRELTYTGRILSGEEAAAIGLVTHARPDPAGAARSLAGEIAARSPDAVRASKQLLNEAWHLPPAESLALEAQLQATVMMKPNQIEAVTANMQKRSPAFSDPEA